MVQLESLSINFLHVSHAVQELKIRDQMLELLVFWVIVVGSNWDAVIDLISERVGSVIDENYVVEVSVREHTQIFNVYTFLGLHTALSKESMMHVLAFRIKVIKHDVSIAAVRRRKDDDLEMLAQLFKSLDCVGSDIDPGLM